MRGVHTRLLLQLESTPVVETGVGSADTEGPGAIVRTLILNLSHKGSQAVLCRKSDRFLYKVAKKKSRRSVPRSRRSVPRVHGSSKPESYFPLMLSQTRNKGLLEES